MKDKEKQIKVFDILDKIEFFQGQRAGRELWNNKPKEIQDKDIADFIKDINYIRSYLQDSVVLSREEYEKLKYTWITDSDAYKKGCKEMTEKIFKMLISKLDSNQFLSGKRIIMEVDVENLAKQFDVEIEG